MEKGQKVSSDTPSKNKKRDDSPESEDGHKCKICRFPLLVALFQLLLGVAVTAVAFLMLAISPSLLARETPHWAGIIVSSILKLHFQPLHCCMFTCLHVFSYFCMSLNIRPSCCMYVSARPSVEARRSDWSPSVTQEFHWPARTFDCFC